MIHNKLAGRVLVTKLYPPGAGSVGMLDRALPSRILARLYRLVLFTAPAGSGKTTMLREFWQSRQASGAAWLSLDESDNDFARFLAHLVSAIAMARPNATAEAIFIVRSNETPTVESVIAALANGMVKEKEPLLVCLDDYHEIAAPHVHKFMQEWLRFMPEQVTLAIASRYEPPWPLGQLRARGALVEVNWDDLHFSTEETIVYLLQGRRLPLSEQEAKQLAMQTEGWPAGLQLTAAALERGIPLSAVMGDMSGEKTHLRDFLLESVWATQPPQVREFLMATALLDRYCKPMCDTMLASSGNAIKHLIQQNLFVFELYGDEGIIWYRYHPLFREFLLTRQPDVAAWGKHVLAAAMRWCADHDYPREALRYALRAGAWDFAADHLQAIGRNWFMLTDTLELNQAIASLPQDRLRTRPSLELLQAWTLLYLGDFEAAYTRLVTPSGLEQIDAVINAERQALKVILGVVSADEPDLSGWSEALLRAMPESDADVVALGHVAQGYALRKAGKLDAAMTSFARAMELTAHCFSTNSHMVAAFNFVLLQLQSGNARRAEAAARECLELVEARHWWHISDTGFVHAALALVLYEQNRLPEALESIDRGIDILDAGRTISYLGVALCDRARILFALDDEDRAHNDLRAARRLAREYCIKRVTWRADLVEFHLHVCRGDLQAALEMKIFGAMVVSANEAFGERKELLLIERGYFDLAQGVNEQTFVRLAAGINNAHAAGRLKHVAEFCLLKAAALRQLERKIEAEVTEAEAKAIAVRGRLLRLAESPLSSAMTASISTIPTNGRLSALRKRELQILRLVAQGLANRDIGKHLFLSETTVKWYLKQIYEAFGVNKRTAAVAKAREMGILGG